jgi:flagellar motor switch protein FliN/FliY
MDEKNKSTKTEENASIPNVETTTERAAEKIADPLKETSNNNLFDPNKLGMLNDVSIALTIEVGRAQIKIRDLLNLSKGSIIELDKSAGDPVDIYANGKLISIGNIITANGKYCVRLMSIPDNHEMRVEQNGK